MANHRELKRLKERYSLLRDWYGAEFAMTEFSASSHTPQARSIADVLPEVLKDVKSPEAGKLLQVENMWHEIIGESFARFVRPGYFRGDEFFVEVSHNALIQELQPIVKTMQEQINSKLGSGFCSKVTLVCSGSRPSR
jgi:predicted nucleic acid-binding Zn ribbon protein